MTTRIVPLALALSPMFWGTVSSPALATPHNDTHTTLEADTTPVPPRHLNVVAAALARKGDAAICAGRDGRGH